MYNGIRGVQKEPETCLKSGWQKPGKESVGLRSSRRMPPQRISEPRAESLADKSTSLSAQLKSAHEKSLPPSSLSLITRGQGFIQR